MYSDLNQVFERRNIHLICVKDRGEAQEKILSMIPKKAVIGSGGSATLKEIGIWETLENGNYEILDKYNSSEAEFFLSGSNAITEDGKIVNIDGTGNRVSALIYGPKKVIIVVGKNKVVKDYETAIDRIKMQACPKNARRLGRNTPCAELEKCVDCQSPDRMCSSTVIISHQKQKERITVILVDEELGY